METFEKLPSDVLRRRDVSPTAKIVYAFMRPLVAKGMRAGYRLIAEQCGISRGAVGRAVDALVGAGLLLRETSSNGQRAAYSLPADRPGMSPVGDPKASRNEAGDRPGMSPEASRNESGSVPLAGHDQTPYLPDRPEGAREVATFEDPLGARSDGVSAGAFATRLYVWAMRDLADPLYDELRLNGRDRERLADIVQWGMSVADSYAANGADWAEAYAGALGGSLDVWREEAKRKPGAVPLSPGGWWARRESWRQAA